MNPDEKDSKSELEEKVIEALESVEAKSILNPESGDLPYGYFHPLLEGKLVWICNYDAVGKITSVFSYDQADKKCNYLESVEDAKKIRQELISAGWQKLKPPKVTFTYPGQKEGAPLTRKQKRFLKKKIKSLQKRNPFPEDPKDPE